VRDVAIGAYTHQDMPFEKLVEELRPDRTLSNTPLFQAAFNYQESAVAESEFCGINLSPIKLDTAIAQFDLLLSMRATDSSISGRIIYYKDLFEPSTIRRMVTHFITLLTSIARDPNARLSELEMLSEEEVSALSAGISFHEEELDFSI
jgi:non-ribosomal peptide synthetase component F